MTRPKVPADKRIRTAQACESCKRRKQKCNGQKPCNTCQKRNLTCAYTLNGNLEGASPESTGTPAKKRHVDPNSPLESRPPDRSQHPSIQSSSPTVPRATASRSRQSSIVEKPKVAFATNSLPEKEGDLALPENDLESQSRNSVVSGPDEETTLLQSTRMLQDPTGRLLYVGDSASLAYLQLIRMIVETRTGPNNFTLDPDRHKIMEATINVPVGTRPLVLPNREMANVLVKSFFINTHGLVEIFNRLDFEKSVEACYSDPLHASPSFLCLLFLTFAIGTVLGTPTPGTREDAVFKKLRNEPLGPEIFFRNARSLGDPVSGFEDADFWSVQALSLMAVYRLAVSKRNTASALLGMAVRSAFALGLHRVQENDSIFTSGDVKLRRNLWRSLFVLDRFLATSMGRPAAIVEDECSEDALLVFEKNAAGELIPIPDADSGMGAAVRSCQVIGQILKRIYARRRVSLRLAQEMADHCRTWYANLHPSLGPHRVRTNTTIDPSPSIAALHVNLLYAHSIILLTRPFFICLLSKVHNERSGHKLPVPRWLNRMSKYCEACFIASNHTILLAQHAFESRYLPQRNPFVLYFLFAACLIILSNEFGSVYDNPSYSSSITNSIAIMQYCSETDPQAKRLLYILVSFRAAVAHIRSNGDRPAHPMPGLGSRNPIASLFASGNSERKPSSVPSWQPPQSSLLHSSLPPLLPPLSTTSTSTGTGSGGFNSYKYGPSTGPPGVSPASSAAASSGIQDHDMSDSVGDGEIDFDSLWQSWNISLGAGGSSTANGAAQTAGSHPAAPAPAPPPPPQTLPSSNWREPMGPLSGYGASVADEVAAAAAAGGGGGDPSNPSGGSGGELSRSWTHPTMPTAASFFSPGQFPSPDSCRH